MLLICDLIDLFGALPFTEIQEFLSTLSVEVPGDTLKQYLFLLERCGLLRIKAKGHGRYYYCEEWTPRISFVLGPLEQKITQRIAANHSPTLKLNEKKRVSVGRGTAMTITGITLSNQGMATVGRQRKRGVRAGALHYIQGLLSPDEIERLKGEIAFVVSIEPGFRLVLLRTYKDAIRPLLPRIKW